MEQFPIRVTSLVFWGTIFLAAAYGSILMQPTLQHHDDLFQNDPLSCRGRCNQSGTIPNGCQCNIPCVQFGDCCPDYYTLCLNQQNGSCAGRCGQPLNPDEICQCNTACQNFNDCCPDYDDVCQQQPITNAELEAMGEDFFRLENASNAAGYVTWNLESNRLLTVRPEAYQLPTIALLIPLHDNYNAAVSIPETFTDEQDAEVDAFVTAILATPIFARLQEFLTLKGIPFTRAKFEQMWFGLYTRGGSGALGSSGFEHVFMGELNNGVSGFHNWVFFAKEEEAERLSYTGYTKFMDLSPKGALIQHNFIWRGSNKPISSMKVATSPEFDLAVFTLCWLTRPDSTTCPMSFGGGKVYVTAYTIGSSKQFVGSAYADPR